MRPHDLTDREWLRLAPLLPPRQRTGRPRKDDRQVINGQLWLACTAAPWRDLPERYGPWRTLATRYEKRADTYAAFVTVAAIRMWLWEAP